MPDRGGLPAAATVPRRSLCQRAVSVQPGHDWTKPEQPLQLLLRRRLLHRRCHHLQSGWVVLRHELRRESVWRGWLRERWRLRPLSEREDLQRRWPVCLHTRELSRRLLRRRHVPAGNREPELRSRRDGVCGLCRRPDLPEPDLRRLHAAMQRQDLRRQRLWRVVWRLRYGSALPEWGVRL